MHLEASSSRNGFAVVAWSSGEAMRLEASSSRNGFAVVAWSSGEADASRSLILRSSGEADASRRMAARPCIAAVLRDAHLCDASASPRRAPQDDGSSLLSL